MNNTFCVLVEGEPHSPELSVFTHMLTRIMQSLGLDYVVNIVDVGGSSAFRSAAKFYYREFPLHTHFPVLAIADRDYKVDAGFDHEFDAAALIQGKKPYIYYWDRHEWENYLLDEMPLICELLNKIPTARNGSKAFRRNHQTIESAALETCLNRDFSCISLIREEMLECLKYIVSNRSRERMPSISYAGISDTASLQDIERWFEQVCQETAAVPQVEVRAFSEIMHYFQWDNILNHTDGFFTEKKRLFRGKEAFQRLLAHVERDFAIHNFNKKLFQKEMLARLVVRNGGSAMYDELESLLSTFFAVGD